jgi:drug/metabolite transporter (DMT)-like permease
MLIDALKLIGSTALWGGTWVSGRILAQDMAPFSAAFLRFLTASVFLFLLTSRLEGRMPRFSASQLPMVLLMGASGVFAYNFFFFAGLQTVTASRAALIIAGIPAMISLFSALIFKERFTPLKAAGVLLSLIGAVVIVSRGEPGALLEQGLARGDMYILGCVASWTAYSLIGKKAMERFSPFSAVTWSCVAGCLMLLVPALATGLIGELASAGPQQFANVLYLGVFATGLGFSWYYSGIKALGPSRAGVFINLVPVFAVLLAFLVLDERPGAALLAGGAVVIAGVWLTNRPTREKRLPGEPM